MFDEHDGRVAWPELVVLLIVLTAVAHCAYSVMGSL
jgi:hypothetical protein